MTTLEDVESQSKMRAAIAIKKSLVLDMTPNENVPSAFAKMSENDSKATMSNEPLEAKTQEPTRHAIAKHVKS